MSSPTQSQQELLAALRAAFADFELPLSPSQAALMLQHWTLLCQWNDRTNLTRVTAPEEAAWRHYRDSAAAASLLKDGPVLDIGSGGGFPGIVLAILRPDLAFTLMEPRRKRASFLQICALRLNLNNIKVYPGRLEDPPQGQFACAVTRATFSDASALMGAASRWLRPAAPLIAYRSLQQPSLAGAQRLPYSLAGEGRCLEVLTVHARQGTVPHT